VPLFDGADTCLFVSHRRFSLSDRSISQARARAHTHAHTHARSSHLSFLDGLVLILIIERYHLNHHRHAIRFLEISSASATRGDIFQREKREEQRPRKGRGDSPSPRVASLAFPELFIGRCIRIGHVIFRRLMSEYPHAFIFPFTPATRR